MSSSWPDAHQAAGAALSKEKWHKALAAVQPWLRGEQPALQGQDWADALTTLSAATRPLGAEVQAAAHRAATHPDDVAALYELGHALVEARRPDLAIAALARAVDHAPDDAGPLAELAAALELQGRNREVIDSLDAAGPLVEADPLLAYLRAFNAFMVADLETPRDLLPRLQAASDERFRFMARRIERMLARADAARDLSRLQPDDLRGWHFVLTAGLLLRTPRLGKTWDSPARIKDAAQRVSEVLEALELSVPTVLFPPERTSEVTARAVASMMGCSATVWHGGDERGLIVVYDARALIPELREALVHHRPGQPLFMQAAEHTTEQPTAPDLLTYLYQHNTSPWGPGLGPDHQLLDSTKIPVDELVQAVADADTETDADQADRDDLRAFATALRSSSPNAAPGALRESGQRERLWVGSPVPKT